MAIPGAVVLVVVIVLVIVAVSGGGSKKAANAIDSTPAAAGVVSDASSVPLATFNQVKVPAGAASAPTVIPKAAALTKDGKPEMLYMGDEWCPYCGASRWPIVVALSRFGTFTGLQTTLSSGSDVDPDTNTFSFVRATYSSPYLSFVPVEMQNSSHATLQTPTAAQAKILQTYDSQGSVPFIDFGNKYIVNSTYDPAVLQGLSWSQIAGQLADPSSTVAKNIDGSANFMSAIICKLTNGQPGGVCTSTGVEAASAILASAK
ncbi:MAG TPA: DUF929 family protein [Acidimicrobiales bacterium]|nr:DUF929 family protein [Acidimicrobiales bacterium]